MSAGRSVNSQSQSWGTPQKYVNAVRKFFGGSISLDPCSNEYSIVHANTEFMLPLNDGLKEKWCYPTIYINPPTGERELTERETLTRMRLNHAITPLDNPLQIKEVRRTIARLATERRVRENKQQ